MAEEKATRKELFERIATVMADDPEVVEMCNKYLEQLNRPRKKKVNEDFLTLASAIATKLSEGGEFTNKELRDWYNQGCTEDEQISSQKMAAVVRHLVQVGSVVRITGEKASDPAYYKLAA